MATTTPHDLEVKPLAHPSPAAAMTWTSTVADEESAAGTTRYWGHRQPRQYLRKRRCLFWCCGCCGATVVILGLVILILALTAFKVRDPVLTLNNLHLDNVDAGLGSSISDPVSFNVTLTADISVKNPNVASFKFDSSKTTFYYEGRTIGVAYAPDGKVGAHKTVTMNVTVDVLGDKIGRTNAAGIVIGGEMLNVTSFTDLNGRVDVWGVYKRNVEVMLNCSLSLQVGIQSQDVKDKVCVATVR